MPRHYVDERKIFELGDRFGPGPVHVAQVKSVRGGDEQQRPALVGRDSIRRAIVFQHRVGRVRALE
jgi:hypothetical protein